MGELSDRLLFGSRALVSRVLIFFGGRGGREVEGVLCISYHIIARALWL